MPERDLNDAKKRMFNFIITVAKALEKRFPDMNFYVENTAFVDPTIRKFQQADLQALCSKFENDNGVHSFQFDKEVLLTQL